jgi:2'-5' RNA ligase
VTTPLSDPTNVQFELVDDEPGFSEVEAIAFLAGADTSTFEVPKIIVAAADVHTGAMIALVPTEEDARRLALDGFEEPDQLHVTFVYLGDAADFDGTEREEIVSAVRQHATEPITARAFSVGIFNPDQEETALVLGVGNAGGEALEELRTRIYDEVRSDFTVADNHSPWIPHITLAYSEHPHELLQQAIQRIGPVTFDRIRVAFGGANVDIPMGPEVAAVFHLKDKHNQQDHNPHKGFRVVSDVKLSRRTKALEAALGENYKKLSTTTTHKDKFGVWDRKRDAVHREIVDEFYKRAADVPNEGRAILLGGNAGAGKSTVITQQAGVDLTKFLKIDPDEVKEELARRGLVPDIPGTDFSPMERSTLVHHESVRIADMLADRAFRDRKNVIWDGTMANAGLVFSRVNRMENAGYSRVDGVFVDVSDETSRRRVAARYRSDLQSWLGGKGLGGRFVPTAVQNAMTSADTRHGFKSLRKANAFDNWVVYDNDVDGQPAKLLAREGVV